MSEHTHDNEPKVPAPRATQRAGGDEFDALGLPERGPVFEGVDAAAARTADVVPLYGTPDSAPARTGAGEVEPAADGVAVEGVVVEHPGDRDGDDEVMVTASVLDAPPERKSWAWAVGWRHKARRLWVYRNRYAWNTFVVLTGWSARSVGWYFRGIGRAMRDYANYVDDRQGLEVANVTAGGVDGKADVDAWLRARAERHRELKDRRRVIRSRIATPLTVLAVLVLAAVWLDLASAVRGVLGPVLLAGFVAVGWWFVWYGRPLTAPFWPQFREPSPYPAVSNDTVTAALLATGITQVKDWTKGGKSPVDVIYRDDTAGGKIAETAIIPGVTTEMLMAKANVVAGALKRPPAMVHLAQAPSDVPGHVEILVLDIDPATTKAPRFAYLGKRVNVGAPITIGYDARNRPVRWTLPGANGITTGTPGAGKTAYLLQLAAAAAMDYDGAQLGVIDFKAMGDYSHCEPVCFVYAGDGDPGEIARKCRDALLGLKREIVRRKAVLTQLKREGSDLLDNDAAALTDRLARHPKYRMPWILLIIDEVHEGIADPVYGPEITALIADIIRIGRAAGVHLEIASQRTDAQSIPTVISTLPILRTAFHQNGQAGNDQILGTGAYKAGIDATAFRRGLAGSDKDDRGSCWFIGGEAGVPVRVRTTFILPDLKRIMTSARTAREKAGTLTGAALGLAEQTTPDEARHSALADVRAAFVAGEKALHGDVIFHRVDTRHPGRWKSQAALIAALKAEDPEHRTPTTDVSQVRPADAPADPDGTPTAGIERTRRGIRFDTLSAAIDRYTAATGTNPTSTTQRDDEDGDGTPVRTPA